MYPLNFMRSRGRVNMLTKYLVVNPNEGRLSGNRDDWTQRNRTHKRKRYEEAEIVGTNQKPILTYIFQIACLVHVLEWIYHLRICSYITSWITFCILIYRSKRSAYLYSVHQDFGRYLSLLLQYVTFLFNNHSLMLQ